MRFLTYRSLYTVLTVSVMDFWSLVFGHSVELYIGNEPLIV